MAVGYYPKEWPIPKTIVLQKIWCENSDQVILIAEELT